jgi:transcriptional regulator with XRE-family HTH domain
MNTNKPQNNSIGERITKSRKILGLSSAKIANKMGLSRSMCSQWERGISNPSTAHLIKLAKVLGVSFEWLATGKESVKANDEMLDETMQNIKINEVLTNLSRAQKHYLLNFLSLIK